MRFIMNMMVVTLSTALGLMVLRGHMSNLQFGMLSKSNSRMSIANDSNGAAPIHIALVAGQEVICVSI